MPKKYSRLVSRWGGLATFPVPQFLLGLKGGSLSIALTLYHQLSKGTRDDNNGPSVKVSQEFLASRTGLSSHASVNAAMNDLVERRIVRVLTERKGQSKRGPVHRQLFGVNRYYPLNPATGLPLQYVAGESLLHTNGLTYFRFPNCVVTESDRAWSMANLSSTQLCAYTAALSFSNWQGARFKVAASELRKRSGIKTPATFRAAVDELENKGLVLASRVDDVYDIEIYDPFTGDIPHLQTGDPTDDPGNYFSKSQKGADKQFDFNAAYREPDYVERLIRSCLDDGDSSGAVEYLGNGNLMVRCPFHDDDKASCSISPQKQCFFCHACEAKGRITDFVMRSHSLPEALAHKYKREMLNGAAAFHRRRNKDASAIYAYKKNGRLVKEKLRFDTTDSEDNAQKNFYLRRPAPGGGWINDTEGVSPILYNHDLLRTAGLIFICEGEKDCERVTAAMRQKNLNSTAMGLIVATTSGGAKSWVDSLADDLRGKRIVVLPDSDVDGIAYRDTVVRSLQNREIEYRVLDFAPFGVNDVSDWLEAGHDAEELATMINQAKTQNNPEHDLIDWIWVDNGEGETTHATGDYCSL
jgi:hypothetical protein